MCIVRGWSGGDFRSDTKGIKFFESLHRGEKKFYKYTILGILRELSFLISADVKIKNRYVSDASMIMVGLLGMLREDS